MESTEPGTGALPQLSWPLVREMLVRFIKDEVHAAGFRKAVVGLSGGVDSAIVACLAAEALGPENVLALLLPHRLSSNASVEHARMVVRKTGVRHETVDITPIVDGFSAAGGEAERVRLGNVMARARMIVLYDRSAREQALVLGTSNKTEILLGYGTQHGDLASAINPVGDLYKTHIWALAELIGVPGEIIRKAPTADLWDGQTDEQELGFTYAEADRMLFAIVDERLTDDEVQRLGFAPELIARVKERIRRNQFKRRPPVIAKISYRTVNVDFRYVRDWGV